MGLFDKMFGRGAEEAEQQQGAQQRFEQLKQKYQSVLNMADQQKIQFQNLHVQDNKLFIRGVAPSEDAKIDWFVTFVKRYSMSLRRLSKAPSLCRYREDPSGS